MGQKENKQIFSNLIQFNIIVLIVLMTLVVTIVLTIIFNYFTSESKARTEIVSNLLGKQTSNYLQEPVHILSLAQSYLNDQVASVDTIQKQIEAIVNSSDTFDAIEYVDSKGIVQAVAPFDETQMFAVRSGQQFYSAIHGGSEIYYSPPLVSTMTGNLTLLITMPLKEGMLVGYLNLDQLSLYAKEFETEFGNNTAISIVDQNGVFISTSNRASILQRRIIDGFDILQQNYLKQRANFKMDSPTGKIIVNIEQVPQTGWYIVVNYSYTHFMSTIRNIFLSFLACLAITVGVSIITSFLYTKKVANQINEYNRQLEKSREEAIMANNVKTQFIANISHEIRTPLNAIVGFSELLNKANQPLNKKTGVYQLTSEKEMLYISSLQTASKSLMCLINDILDMSKLEAGEMTLEPSTVNIRQMMKDLELIFMERAVSSNNIIKFTIDDDLPEWLYIDENRLRQILINLIGNSLKFTTNGVVEVEATMFSFNSESERINVAFSVADTGIGIPEEELNRVFGAFQQGRGHEVQYGGTGLGLSISKRFAQLMDGTIEVVSKEGVGSRFTLLLSKVPVQQSRVVVKEVVENAEELSLVNIKVLIADDEPLNRLLLREALESKGVLVYEAVDGLEAIELARGIKPAIIIMDIRMPNVNGIEATHHIKQREELKDIPIIAYTASVRESTEEVLEDLFEAVLYKPVDFLKLEETLKMIFSKR